jgi:23S rRNA pseudouridine2605 synthase
LQKVLAAAGVASRRKAEQLMLDGQVCVNGRVVRELGTRVDAERDRITVDWQAVTVERKVYFLLNKPDGVVCSAEGKKDERGRSTVLSLFRGIEQRIYPVGRLDFHTRGALIVTNDGELAGALCHPRNEVAKTYHVKFQGKLPLGVLESLQSGVELEDGVVTREAMDLSVIRETMTNTWVQLTISQGLYRQIRRMGEAVGHPVLKLIRVAIGGLTADGLDDGEYRGLTASEVYELRSLCKLV